MTISQSYPQFRGLDVLQWRDSLRTAIYYVSPPTELALYPKNVSNYSVTENYSVIVELFADHNIYQQLKFDNTARGRSD